MNETRFAKPYRYEGNFGGEHYTGGQYIIGQYLMWQCRNMAFFISFFGSDPEENEVGDFAYIPTPEPKFNHYKI